MKVEKLISHIRIMLRGEYIYSKEKLYEKLNVDLNDSVNLKVGKIISYDGNEYKIISIDFNIIPGEWFSNSLKEKKIVNVIEEEEDTTPTNCEITIYLE